MSSMRQTFTIEQFELIRRLKNSGVTCEQIIESFRAFDKIDAELGSLFASPVSSISNSASARNMPMSSTVNPAAALPQVLSGSNTSNTVANMFLANMANGDMARTLVQTSTACMAASGDARTHAMDTEETKETKQGNISPDSNGGDSVSFHSNNNSSQQHIPNINSFDNNVTSSSRPVVPHFGLIVKQEKIEQQPNVIPDTKFTMQDVDMERCLEFLLSQSQDMIMELIRKLVVTLPDFNPTQAATIPGMTETSLTHVLSGDLQCLGLEVKMKVIEWLVFHLKRTDWFMQEFGCWLKTEQPEGLGVHFTPRRERFMFREKHLEVLETYFKRVQYPTPEEKDQIANECNVAMAISRRTTGPYIPGERTLGDKEKMTPFNVSNWFSNRRKEIKRMAKISGIDTEKVILPSRVKAKPNSYLPSYSDMMNEHSRKFYDTNIPGTMPGSSGVTTMPYDAPSYPVSVTQSATSSSSQNMSVFPGTTGFLNQSYSSLPFVYNPSASAPGSTGLCSNFLSSDSGMKAEHMQVNPGNGASSEEDDGSNSPSTSVHPAVNIKTEPS